MPWLLALVALLFIANSSPHSSSISEQEADFHQGAFQPESHHAPSNRTDGSQLLVNKTEKEESQGRPPTGPVRSEQDIDLIDPAVVSLWCDDPESAPDIFQIGRVRRRYCPAYVERKEKVHKVDRRTDDRESLNSLLEDLQSRVWRASWYGPGFHLRKMANGQTYDMNDPTVVANPWLPFGIKLELTNIENGKTTVLTVQDRGPFVEWDPDRIFDLSKQAATDLGLKPGTSKDEGLATVRVRVLSLPPRS